jgi:hypothetical protein
MDIAIRAGGDEFVTSVTNRKKGLDHRCVLYCQKCRGDAHEIFGESPDMNGMVVASAGKHEWLHHCRHSTRAPLLRLIPRTIDNAKTGSLWVRTGLNERDHDEYPRKHTLQLWDVKYEICFSSRA